MQTVNTYACMLEDGATIKVGGFVYRSLSRTTDDDDYILFDTRDEDGELTQLPFAPFDTVTEVLAEEDDVTVEDIEVDI